MEVFHDFPRDWADSAPEVDSPALTGVASVARLLSLEICTLFLRASCVFSLFSVRNFARVFFWGFLAFTVVSARGPGGPGVAGSFTPR